MPWLSGKFHLSRKLGGRSCCGENLRMKGREPISWPLRSQLDVLINLWRAMILQDQYCEYGAIWRTHVLKSIVNLYWRAVCEFANMYWGVFTNLKQQSLSQYCQLFGATISKGNNYLFVQIFNTWLCISISTQVLWWTDRTRADGFWCHDLVFSFLQFWSAVFFIHNLWREPTSHYPLIRAACRNKMEHMLVEWYSLRFCFA